MPAKILVPELGESVLEATVGRWLKEEGERVRVGDVLVALETDKVDLEVGAEKDGILVRIERKEGANVKIGDVLGILEETPTTGAERETIGDGQAERPRAAKPKQETAAAIAEPTAEPRKVTPLARRVAQEHGVDLHRVPASEPGRVRQRDIEAYLHSKPGGEPAPAPEDAGQPAAPPVEATVTQIPISPAEPVSAGRERSEERVRMSRRRLTIARRLVEAQHTAAMLTTFNEVDMSAVMQLRARWRELFKQRHGVGLGISSFFVKASVGALREFPRLNAEVQGNEMVLKHYFDIGVAIGAEEGLVVQVRDGPIDPRGPSRRNVHHHERWRLRLAAEHPDSEPSPDRHPGTAQDPGPRHGRGGASPDPAHDVCGAQL
jgi:2-oxoglutarate dehydrogenase E2 component (dihydrolipoamide succinyltransferase)